MLGMIGRVFERVHVWRRSKWFCSVPLLVTAMRHNHNASPSSLSAANRAFHVSAFRPLFTRSPFPHLRPDHKSQTLTSCIAASQLIRLRHPTPRMSRRQSVREAIHLPSFFSHVICVQESLYILTIELFFSGQALKCKVILLV